jgi:hypothetical protein
VGHGLVRPGLHRLRRGARHPRASRRTRAAGPGRGGDAAQLAGAAEPRVRARAGATRARHRLLDGGGSDLHRAGAGGGRPAGGRRRLARDLLGQRAAVPGGRLAVDAPARDGHRTWPARCWRRWR